MAVAAAMAAIQVANLRHLRLCSAQAKPLAAFYESALGFRQVSVEHLSGARTQDRLRVSGRTLRITLELGAQRIKLLQFVDRPGHAYPAGSDAADRVFQHFAIVVADMAAAFAHLTQTPGWTPITRGGPQQLPASSGSVAAFKFRDPEGHPLELLAFPPHDGPPSWQQRQRQGDELFLGIDHSAISVANSARSIAFYQSLGLTLADRSLNDDPTQAALDGLDRPVVEVTAMAPLHATPHVELLCYRRSSESGRLDLSVNDVAATCLVFEATRGWSRAGTGHGPVHDLVDPDGHRLAIVGPMY